MNLGAIYNLTGDQQTLDLPSSQGVRLAVDEINQGNGILGGKINLILRDGKTDPAVIEKVTEEIIASSKDVPVLIGMSDTDVVLAAATVAATHKRIFITSGATSPVLPEQVPTYLFLACYGDNVQAAAAADFAYNDLKKQKAVVLYKEDMSYTELLRKYFETSFMGLGGKILLSKGYKAGNFADAVSDLPEADFIYLSASPDEVIDGVAALRNAGVTSPILSGDGFDIGEKWAELPNEDNVYFTTHADVGADNTSPEVTAFRAAYAKKFPGQEPDAFTALGYDTVKLVAAAVNKAGNYEVEAIRGALSTLKDFGGITGNISFSKGSQIPVKSVALMRVNKGDEKFIREVLPANVPAP